MKKYLSMFAVAIFLALATTASAKDKIHQDFIYDGLTPDVLPSSLMFTQTRQSVINGDFHGLATLTVVPAAPSSGYVYFILSGLGICVEDSSGNVTLVGGLATAITSYPDGGYVSTAGGDRYISGLEAVDGGIVDNGPLTAGTASFTTLTASGATAIDGGVVINNTLSSKALAATTGIFTGLVGVDGGAIVQNGLTLSGGAVADSALVSGAVGVDGGLNANGGKAVPVVQDSTASTFILHNHGAVGTPVTFATSFSATPECVCTDLTAGAAVKCLTSGGPPVTTLTFTGTGTDAISWICIGPR